MTIIILISSLFLSSNHPLMMILCLVTITLFMSLSMLTSLSTPWYTLILILILLGAMLIIFLYMASLAPNEIMHLNMSKPLITLIIFIPIILMTTKNKITPSFSGLLYSSLPSPITIMAASYLLITMIAIVKITTLHQGPMKSD
uniref:NADH dehydrogenase subunit 6 n=1 Tax=Charinus carajas TaxID=3045142 RepID=UPI002580ECC9|nr:NADH dehydrogenase subunit 6 [Charinus carajas]WGV34171.1 NADH dehydrogenase subunit 6 [Charinus carajas]WGV34184.1 NADH dehydrogenase subunit 6 [Charinus carajas]WGV34197.1 NADH dehydrogenase subunit 6 [Charinus carajas]